MKWLSIFIWLFFWAALLFSQPEQRPNDLFKAGISAYQQNDYDLSLKCFTQAIDMDPNRNYFYYNRGRTFEAMGNNVAAAADFRKSLALKTTAEAYYELGLLAYQKNDLSQARTEFENARSIREDIGNMNFFLGLINFKEKKYEEGYKCFQVYTAHNKSNAEAYYYEGFCAAELGMRNEAIENLKFATVYNGKDFRYFLKMYEVYKALGDNVNALNNISMVIELGERKAEFYADRADLYKATGQQFLADEDEKSIGQLGTTAETK